MKPRRWTASPPAAMAPVTLAGRAIGPGQPCFIIAEAGVNHDGDAEQAKRLIDVAARSGADAVKFQTFRADRLVSPKAPKAAYQLRATAAEESQWDMLKRLELSEEAHRRLQAHSHARGILFLSTPFDEASADFLDSLGVPAFKLASSELMHWRLLEHVARKAKPLLLSTGMSNAQEVGEAVRAVRRAGSAPLILLHCVSNYPAHPADANLRAMHTMAEMFQVPVGYSDHTPGIEVALAAVALGACVVEKHITLDRTSPGPDHQASLEPQELAALVRGIRVVESALGTGRKEPAPGERDVARVARRSLVALQDIPAGASLTEALVGIRRPGTGLPPADWLRVIGRRAAVAIPAGTPLQWEALE